MGNICFNQRPENVNVKNEEKDSQKKLQSHADSNSQIEPNAAYNITQVKELLKDLEGESQSKQDILYLSPNFKPSGLTKISISDFQLIKVLGRGSFGKVMLVQHIYDKQYYAMKVISKNTIKNERQKRHAMTERDVLAKSNNPFIVDLHYAFQTPTKLYLILDFMPGGELFCHLKKARKFNEATAKFFSAQICLGLEHLHNKNIIYRDLKPENVLLDSKGHIKLADFGLSKIESSSNLPAQSLCGTPEYLAPEIITSKSGHDKTVDWWSFGSLLYEMLTGTPPFYSNNKKQMLQNIIYKQIPMPKILSAKAKSLLEQLLVVNPQHRLGYGPKGAEDVMKHQFFSDINWNEMKNKKISSPLQITLDSLTDTKYFDPYLVKEQVQDSVVSVKPNAFEFSQFSFIKQNQEVQLSDIKNEEQAKENVLFDDQILNSICKEALQKGDPHYISDKQGKIKDQINSVDTSKDDIGQNTTCAFTFQEDNTRIESKELFKFNNETTRQSAAIADLHYNRNNVQNDLNETF